ncbi:DJ-1/PfpI family protein [Croceitalea rosinachiae]|uniref:DJ-1/PfpI family protein n=1 Tax=Croceitalea rosinachiae TaxID=3075596 RepID=A0ABU3A8I5_9FLAO|nr:DJ-1/PfpI family protein [Croceitalea sp. F388]MDT0606269.1 DJ-1/PfpI family protein [Croceitalea sp. F388]
MELKLKKPILRLVVIFHIVIGLSAINAQEHVDPFKSDTMEIAFIMFDDYETLDVFGPAEIFGRLVDKYNLTFYSLKGGVITNRHGVPIMTQKLATIKSQPNIILVPGGMGTRKEVDNTELLTAIRELSLASDYVLSVCTGSALLAKSGLLDGKQATSNKRAFSWASSQSANVDWDKKARWKVDGKYYTSSGVSAGMDMSLGFISDRHGIDFARKVAKEIEYNWIEEKDNDNFIAE